MPPSPAGPLTLSLVNDQPGFPVPSFISLMDHGDGTGRITVTPHAGDRGDYAVRLVATDAADARGPSVASFTTFVISVTSANEPPT